MYRVYKITHYKLVLICRCTSYIHCLYYVLVDDSNDRPYLVNNQTQFLAWALGPRATEEGLRDLAFFHTEYPRNGGVQSNMAVLVDICILVLLFIYS